MEIKVISSIFMSLMQTSSEHANGDLPVVLDCKNGDVEAFQVIVERYQRKMLNIAYRVLDDYEDACDIVQEAFISAFKALPSFRGESTFSVWLTSIVMNHSRNRLKQRKTRASRECVSLDAPKDPENEGAVFELPSQHESAHERMEKMELERRVQNCINKLPDDHREIVVLRDIQGFSYDEISSALMLSDGTVKSRLFRARDALKECLSDVIGFIGATA